MFSKILVVLGVFVSFSTDAQVFEDHFSPDFFELPVAPPGNSHLFPGVNRFCNAAYRDKKVASVIISNGDESKRIRKTFDRDGFVTLEENDEFTARYSYSSERKAITIVNTRRKDTTQSLTVTLLYFNEFNKPDSIYYLLPNQRMNEDTAATKYLFIYDSLHRLTTTHKYERQKTGSGWTGPQVIESFSYANWNKETYELQIRSSNNGADSAYVNKMFRMIRPGTILNQEIVFDDLNKQYWSYLYDDSITLFSTNKNAEFKEAKNGYFHIPHSNPDERNFHRHDHSTWRTEVDVSVFNKTLLLKSHKDEFGDADGHASWAVYFAETHMNLFMPTEGKLWDVSFTTTLENHTPTERLDALTTGNMTYTKNGLIREISYKSKDAPRKTTYRYTFFD